MDPKKCGPDDWTTINDSEEVGEAIQDKLASHFAQAEETDFCQSPLKEDTNFSADTDTAEQILAGEHPYDETHLRLATAMLLRHMARSIEDEITITLTGKQFAAN